MDQTILAGSGHPALAQELAHRLDADLADCRVDRFPDGETSVRIASPMADKHVLIVQPTGPPVDSRLFEVALLADAARRAGAVRVTAVIPYFGYARQDRRRTPGEPVAVRVAADLLRRAVDGVVVVDPHLSALEAVLGIPTVVVDPFDALREALEPILPREAVVVAPDFGAAKRARRWADALALPVAMVQKTRLSGAEVMAGSVLGSVRGKNTVIVDDMISTGRTIVAAWKALSDAGCLDRPILLATHGLFVGQADEELRQLRPRHVLITDSLPQPESGTIPREVVPIAETLARALAT